MRKGVFSPKKLDTLRSSLIKHIGKSYWFHFMWKHDDSVYSGQGVYWAFSKPEYKHKYIELNSYWVPDEDIDWETVN